MMMSGVNFWTSAKNHCHRLSESLAVASASALPPWARVINVSISTAAVLTSVVKKTYIPHLTGIVFEGQPIPAPLALPW
jgi:hypothetical protein